MHTQQSHRSGYWIVYSILTISTIIVGRLFYLQIHISEHFHLLSEKNYLRIEHIKPDRGNIVDCNGKLLATNCPTTHVVWYGTGAYCLTVEQEKVISTLSSILNIDIKQDSHSYNALKHAERYGKHTTIAHNITFAQLSKIKEQFTNNPNIGLSIDAQRYYPHKQHACHILGYLGSINTECIGKMGLEKMFHEHLQGQYGQLLKTINATGKSLSKKELKQRLNGQTIYTTIDITLQNMIEQVFPADKKGTLIVMDPVTGAIKALLSRPNFDPSLFLQPMSNAEWQKLQEQQPFINRACNAQYPPGSIVKLIAVAAALEEGLIQTDSQWDCKGYVWCGTRKFWCNRRYGHNEISTLESLAQSCNVMFYQIGKQMKIDTLARYAYMFGLGKKTGIIFHEKEGLIPTTEWKRRTKRERWWPGETLSAMIGQSYFLVTPIQVARMIGAIFTGNLITPHIIPSEHHVTEKLSLKESTCAFLQKSMKKVVTKGTGKRLKQLKDITIYAKTSTAQTSAFEKRKLGEQYQEHGWFVSYFHYKEQQPLVMVILVEHAGTARVATTSAKEFFMKYKKHIDMLPLEA